MGGNNANLLNDIKVSRDKLTKTAQTVTQAQSSFTTQSNELLALIEQLDEKFKELEEREAAVEKRENEVNDKIQLVQAREQKCTDREQKVGVREQLVSGQEVKWIETEKKMQQNAANLPSVVQLSISGTRFAVEKDKLVKCKGSLLEQAIISDHPPLTPNGELFFARDPAHFRYIVSFLLDGSTEMPSRAKKREAIVKEFAYYNIPLKFPEPSLLPTITLDLVDDGKFGVKIKEWLPGKKFVLLYKASEDGYGAADFHKKCDNKGPTLTVIRSTNGYLFGGYTSAHWDSTTNNGYKKCTEAFLFTLTNPHNIPPTKYTCHATDHAIWLKQANYGASFGQGCDLIVYNNSHQNTNNNTNFPFSYTDTTGKGNATFTGAKNFTVQEIEIFSVLNK